MAETSSGPNSQLAALDLGSNSFHLLVAQESNGRVQVLDKIKEMVRLAAGLDDENRLAKPVVQRALDCLQRFGQRIKNIPPQNVRVVGTNTLRKARNAADFLSEAETLLGHPVEIISGREEARLIYLGVSHSLEDNYDRRLVVDIGGGSTEAILGRSFRAEKMESLYMGCVSMSQSCFGDGKIRAAQFKQAVNFARQELEPIKTAFNHEHWDTAIGASGTILAVADVLDQMGEGRGGITLEGLEAIRKAIIRARQVDKLSLPGLATERAPVFPGGVAILYAIFKSLDIEKMQVTNGALREGLLYDLIGRVQHQDVREHTVQDLMARYHVDQPQARRIRESAISLLAQVAESWQLTDPNHQLLLGWAADLHEIGMDIAHSQYHKHGGYLLQHMDMPGFSRLDQMELAALVRAHRRKFPMDEGPYAPDTLRLAVLLRIACVIHRPRVTTPLPHIGARASGDSIEIVLPESWLEAHPLTRLDLEQEARYLKVIPVALTIRTATPANGHAERVDGQTSLSSASKRS